MPRDREPSTRSDAARVGRRSAAHLAAGVLLLLGVLLALIDVGIPAYRRSGLSNADLVASVAAIASAAFAVRTWSPASVERSLRARFSTDAAASLMLLVIATVIWWWVKHGIGR